MYIWGLGRSETVLSITSDAAVDGGKLFNSFLLFDCSKSSDSFNHYLKISDIIVLLAAKSCVYCCVNSHDKDYLMLSATVFAFAKELAAGLSFDLAYGKL